MMPLKTARLRQLFELVPQSTECVVDVGTDHGLLPIALVQSGRAQRAIASDLRAAPLEGAMRHIKRAQVSDRVEVRCGPGLSTVEPGEAQVCVLAGMGSRTIMAILEAVDLVALGIERVITQTPRGGGALRQFMWESKSWHIAHEALMYDAGRHYMTCVALPGRCAAVPFDELSPQDQLISPQIWRECRQDCERFATERVETLGRTLEGLARSGREQEREAMLAKERRLWMELLGR